MDGLGGSKYFDRNLHKPSSLLLIIALAGHSQSQRSSPGAEQGREAENGLGARVASGENQHKAALDVLFGLTVRRADNPPFCLSQVWVAVLSFVLQESFIKHNVPRWILLWLVVISPLLDVNSLRVWIIPSVSVFSVKRLAQSRCSVSLC